MNVTLAPLAQDDREQVAHLGAHPDQLRFSGPVAAAFDAAGPDMDCHAILADNTTVGFSKIDRGYSNLHGFAETGDLGLRNVIIDAVRQGQGLGTTAMRAACG
ncbi:MAG: GNAT family N-acetyltransferase [Rhodobacterales bacterium]